jgi:hypothetical protein
MQRGLRNASVCGLLLLSSSAFTQEPSQPVRMMLPPPPLQWPTVPVPPSPPQLLLAPKVRTNAPVRADYLYPYSVESRYFGYVRGYRTLDGTQVAGQYDLKRRW